MRSLPQKPHQNLIIKNNQIETINKYYKLPDHHNNFGDAYWINKNIKEFKCVVSPKK